MDKLLDPRTLVGLSAFNILCIVFGGGIMWAKVDSLTAEVADLQLRAERVTPAAGERLARIEAILLGLRDDNIEIKRRLERLEQR